MTLADHLDHLIHIRRDLHAARVALRLLEDEDRRLVREVLHALEGAGLHLVRHQETVWRITHRVFGQPGDLICEPCPDASSVPNAYPSVAATLGALAGPDDDDMESPSQLITQADVDDFHPAKRA